MGVNNFSPEFRCSFHMIVDRCENIHMGSLHATFPKVVALYWVLLRMGRYCRSIARSYGRSCLGVSDYGKLRIR